MNHEELNARFQQLKKEADLKYIAHRQYGYATTRLVDEAREPHQRALDAAATEVYESRRAEDQRLHAEVLAAEQARDAAAIELAESDPNALAAGTTVFRWTRGYYKAAWKLEGGKGVVEIWTKDSVRSENMRHHLPNAGARVVRPIKKDGTPSKNIERFGGHGDKWLPAGVNPNEVAE